MNSAPNSSTPLRVAIFGPEAESLIPHIEAQPGLLLVDNDPDVVVTYGGDGSLLGAELRWPGLPKLPILNSRLGNRCIAKPAGDLIRALAEGALTRHEYGKLECAVHFAAPGRMEPDFTLSCLNEINVHMGRINSAVRFKLWVNEEPFDGGVEILGDGFVVCTPFGSTAYFNAITRGVFTRGIGVAFKATAHRTDHLVLPDDVVLRLLITRGPAVLAFDSSAEYLSLDDGDELIIRRHGQGAVILACGPVHRPHDPF